MKALSIKQPWASLIAHGVKDIENRTWKTNFRGRIYVHASAKDFGSLSQALNQDQWNKTIETWTSDYFPNRPLSAIIGEVDIVDCVINHESIWAEKSDVFRKTHSAGIVSNPPIYNWVLANSILYKNPILNVKGKLSFWEPDLELEECIWCSGKSEYDKMIQDSGDENYCPECWKEAEPILKAEYDELVAKGEIEPE